MLGLDQGLLFLVTLGQTWSWQIIFDLEKVLLLVAELRLGELSQVFVHRPVELHPQGFGHLKHPQEAQKLQLDTALVVLEMGDQVFEDLVLRQSVTSQHVQQRWSLRRFLSNHLLYQINGFRRQLLF